MKKKKLIFASVIIMAVCTFCLIIGSKVLATSDDDVITQGVYMDSISLGGMTVAEAEQAVQDYVDALKSKKITVSENGNSNTITLADLEYNYKENNYIEEALKIGKSGNLIKRYKDLKDVEENNVIYNLEFDVNGSKLNEFIKENFGKYDVAAVNATVTRENGVFVYTDETVGKKVDVDQTVAAVKKAILENWNQEDITLDATVVADEPLYTRESVEKCKTLLGTYSTTFTSSTADRAGNVSNGANLINNTVLYPGDVFSAYDKLQPFTVENGYFTAGAYANGKVIDSVGGGACQVTTTLYNAVLFSELEVVERSSHSMTISYVDLSRDAAIAGTWKDLKFKNNMDVPILIEGYTVGRTITFNVWGCETRDIANREIKFETVILEEKQPGEDVVEKDPTQPATYNVTTQAAHIGYVAELYKVEYKNGVEVNRTKVNQSIYNASPRYITVGSKKDKKKDEDKKKDKESTDSVETSADGTKKDKQKDINTTEVDTVEDNSMEDDTVEDTTEDDSQN